jgi:DNA repair protein RadC
MNEQEASPAATEAASAASAERNDNRSFSFNLSLPCVREASETLCRTPEDVRRTLDDTAGLAQEAFTVLTLNKKNRVIDRHLITLGLVDASLIHPREVFRAAVMDNASSIIISHNHPTGDPTPSAEDLSITRRLVDAGRVLDIRVLDHVIVGRGALTYFSIRDAGVISFEM